MFTGSESVGRVCGIDMVKVLEISLAEKILPCSVCESGSGGCARDNLHRHPGRDLSPPATSRAPTALPGVRVDEVKVVGDAGAGAEVVRIIRRDGDIRDGSARGVGVHLDGGASRVRRPEQIVAGTVGDRGVGGVPGGFGPGDHGTAARDEAAPDLLERVDEVGRRCRCVDGEVCRQVGAVVRGRDGVLVLPALLARAGEGFREPVPRAGVRDLAVEVVGALLLAGGELGLVQSGGSAVAEGIE